MRSARRGEYDQFEPMFCELRKRSPDDPSRTPLRDELITAHLPVAEHVAWTYRSHGEPEQDLVQVATIGLIHAVDRYDPAYGNGFLPYAIPTIRGEVLRYFRDLAWSIRVPRRMKELRLALAKGTAELSERLGRSPRPSELATHLGLSRAQVCEGLAAAAAYRPASLNQPLRQDDTLGERGDFVGDDDLGFENVEESELLRPALRSLPERERRIVALRFFKEMTQSQIARVMGISQMHVSRLLAKALEQIRRQIVQNRPA